MSANSGLGGRGLLPTKLHPRQTRARIVSRPRLIEELERASSLPLTVVSGPAGAGKSTAVVAWIEQTGRPVAWLSLDPGDDAPNRFFAYLFAALGTLVPGLGGEAASLLGAPEPDAPEELEALLADELVIPLAERSEPVVVVLDDLHLIEDPRIHGALAWLIDHRPSCLHLVVLSRKEPPLPLSRLRARGQLGEIDGEALRFSAEEARRFYAEVMALELDEERVAAIEARTEGWPAGAQLAALSLRAGRKRGSQGGEDTGGRGGGRSPRGDDRIIADYLLAEVFEALEPRLRAFLLASSVLERLCAPLCAAVLDDEDAREDLAEVERANLFLIPLDTHGRWFRFHHLFRDFLRERARAEGPERARTLHLRAAGWLAERDLRQEAFEHAVASGDEATITALFERWAAETLVWNHTGGARAWLKMVPAGLREREAAYWFIDGWCDVIVGALGAGLSKLDRADEALAEGRASDSTRFLMVGLGPVLRVAAHLRAGRHDLALALAAEHKELLEAAGAHRPGAPDALALGYAGFCMHEALVWIERGELDRARELLERAEPLMRRDKGTDVLVLAHLAEVHRRSGRPELADRCARRALAYAEETGTSELSPAGLARVELGWLALERGEVREALREVEHGLERLRRLRDVAYLARGTELLARARAAAGERGEALDVVDDALILLEDTDMAPALARMRALREELSATAARPKAATVPELEGSPLPPMEALTSREREVLGWVATGLANREIAERLHVSIGTIKTHMHRIIRKLGVQNRTQAVHRARQAGVLA